MQLSRTLLVAILGSAVIAAPIAEPAAGTSAAVSQWTLQSFTRTCNAADTSCKYSYTINPRDSTLTICSYVIPASNQASRASYNNIKCGNFLISSSWSGQFGAGNGFSTLGVVRNGQIIYPSYKDTQLVNGKVVSPDQSYTPQKF